MLKEDNLALWPLCCLFLTVGGPTEVDLTEPVGLGEAAPDLTGDSKTGGATWGDARPDDTLGLFLEDRKYSTVGYGLF